MMSNEFFLQHTLLLSLCLVVVAIFSLATVVAVIVFWRAMRAHESIANSLKIIALNMRIEACE